MKAFSFIAIFLLALTAHASGLCPIISEDGTVKHTCDTIFTGEVTFDGSVVVPGGTPNTSLVTQTSDDLPLFVRTAGNDSNDCITEPTACLTIQAAVDKVPFYISHNVVLDIGEGTFDSFHISDRIVTKSPNGSFVMRGVLGAPTLTTGTTSGTKTGGTGRTFQDSGQSWTVDELVGMFLKLGTDYRVIKSNTATELSLIGTAPAGTTYDIVEPKTTITSASGYSTIQACKGDSGAEGAGFNLQNLKFSPGTTFAIATYYRSSGIRFDRIHVIGNGVSGYGTWLFQDNVSSGASIFDSYLAGGALMFIREQTIGEVDRVFVNGTNASHGIAVSNVMRANFDEIHIEGSARHGIEIAQCVWADIDVAFIENSAGWGIVVDNNDPNNSWQFGGLNLFSGSMVNALATGGSIELNNNAQGGVYGRNHSVIALSDCTGTGNGSYGLRLDSVSKATITTDTVITGSSGDATIDNGTTVLTWSTDFANDGDILVNTGNFTRIERRD